MDFSCTKVILTLLLEDINFHKEHSLQHEIVSATNVILIFKTN